MPATVLLWIHLPEGERRPRHLARALRSLADLFDTHERPFHHETPDGLALKAGDTGAFSGAEARGSWRVQT